MDISEKIAREEARAAKIKTYMAGLRKIQARMTKEREVAQKKLDTYANRIPMPPEAFALKDTIRLLKGYIENTMGIMGTKAAELE